MKTLFETAELIMFFGVPILFAALCVLTIIRLL